MKWHDKCNICCRYCIYHVKFNICLVAKPLECSPQKQSWTLRFCVWGWIMWKMYDKTITEFGFRMISWIIKIPSLCYLPQPSASAGNTDLGFDNSWYHAQPHPIIVYYYLYNNQINARALIGQSAVGYCYYKPTEKSRVFWIITFTRRIRNLEELSW